MLPIVNEFNQLYNKLEMEYHNRWSDDQLKKHAHILYCQNCKKHLYYEHVWVMLKNDPKWKENNSLPRS